MTIRTRHQINASKQKTLLDGVGVGLPKQSVCWRGLNRSVHEAMKNISNVKGHFELLVLFFLAQYNNNNDTLCFNTCLCVGLPKQSMCWRGLNRSVHEAMKNISNVKGHLKPRVEM